MHDFVRLTTSNKTHPAQSIWPALLHQRLLWNSVCFLFCDIKESNTHMPHQHDREKDRVQQNVPELAEKARRGGIWTTFFFFTQRLTGTCRRFIREINVNGSVEGNWAFSSKTSWEAHVRLFPSSVTRSPRNPPKSVKRQEDCKVCVSRPLLFFGLTSALHGLSVDTHAGLIAENSKSDYPPDRWVVLTNWKDVEAAFSPASDYITELLTHHTPSFVYLLFTVTTSEHMSEVF